MENKRKALGKGLEELFNSESLELEKIEQKIIEESKEEIKEVELDSLRSNPYQPRKTFDEESLNELSSSIKEYGVFQPIIIKKSIKGYEIVAGERRVKASLMAGLKKIPAIIKDFTDEQMMQIALLENLQRENLTSIEEANAYSKMLKSMNFTQEELAKKIGKSRSHVTNMLGLLNLPKNVQDLIGQVTIYKKHLKKIIVGILDCGVVADLSEYIELIQTIDEENINVVLIKGDLRRHKKREEYIMVKKTTSRY